MAKQMAFRKLEPTFACPREGHSCHLQGDYGSTLVPRRMCGFMDDTKFGKCFFETAILFPYRHIINFLVAGHIILFLNTLLIKNSLNTGNSTCLQDSNWGIPILNRVETQQHFNIWQQQQRASNKKGGNKQCLGAGHLSSCTATGLLLDLLWKPPLLGPQLGTCKK